MGPRAASTGAVPTDPELRVGLEERLPDLPPFRGLPQHLPPNKRLTLAELEKAHILAALHEHDWNKAQAAKALRINRAMLCRKLKVFNSSHPG